VNLEDFTSISDRYPSKVEYNMNLNVNMLEIKYIFKFNVFNRT